MSEIMVSPVTPMDLIQKASAQGASIEQMQQLFELKLRVEANEAKKAFNEAMADFKKAPPQINKNRHVKFENSKGGFTEYDHATLDNVVDLIAPALSIVGIRHRWENKQEGPLISVTCLLSHQAGHSEATTLTATSDQSGGKNGIQAIASTVTYLQRYTLLGAVGMAAGGADNDGADPRTGPRMPDTEVIEHLQYIENASCLADLTKLFKMAYKDAVEAKDEASLRKFIEAKDKRKGEL